MLRNKHKQNQVLKFIFNLKKLLVIKNKRFKKIYFNSNQNKFYFIREINLDEEKKSHAKTQKVINPKSIVQRMVSEILRHIILIGS